MITVNSLTSDKTIREVLLRQLTELYKKESQTAIVSELTLPYGSARIDIAVINGEMHGYELKSDIDTLLRLTNQIDAYNLFFDKITLVVAKKHLLKALSIIPDWWGITIAKIIIEKDETRLIPIRNARTNPQQDITIVANMLWKNEALSILNKIGKSKGLRTKSKKIICENLVKSVRKKQLKGYVREFLYNRSQSQVV